MNIFKKIIENSAKNIQLITINFAHPWWAIFLQQKATIILVLCALTVSHALKTLFPMLIRWSLETTSLINLVIIASIYFTQEIIETLVVQPRFLQLYCRTIESFRYNAYRTLLIAQPDAHAHQSSGIGIGKIRRTMEAYKDLVRNLFEDVMPLTIALLTTMVTLMSFNFYLGLISSAGIIGVSIFFCWTITTQTRSIEQQTNYDDDCANHAGAESLIHTKLIHTRRATQQTCQHLADQHINVTSSSIKLHMTYRLMQGFFMLTYITSICGTTGFLLYLMHCKTMDSLTALALVATLLRSTNPLLKLDKRIRKILSAYRKIIDCFAFIQKFKQNNNNLLNTPVTPHNNSTLILNISNVTIAHPHTPPLFNDLSCIAMVPKEQKIHTLIGPPGSGKTTLFCAIAGHFKPLHGTIQINGHDPYQLHENQQKKLVLLLGEDEAYLHETVAYNLKLGAEQAEDKDLIKALMLVDLWCFFEQKNGLQTMLGDGGTQLSKSQQQCLNLANFYLRIQEHRPLLVIIDEPFKKLDIQHKSTAIKLIKKLSTTTTLYLLSRSAQPFETWSTIITFEDFLAGTTKSPLQPEYPHQQLQLHAKNHP